ncbi:MAG: uroporphyrinogen decarboxylase family protein [Finegoldia sp.]|nr:uroporphyrinogen decarboxylase family protein [Finegoldia sp.]
MFKDEMTPKERMEAFSKGEEIDRIPIVPDMGVTMSGYLGYKTWDYYSNSDVIADTEVALFKRFYHDSISVSTTLRGMAEAMGSEISYPDDNISQLNDPVVKTVEDIEKLKIIDPLKDGKLPILIEALEKIRDQVGDVAPIGAAMTGPFSVAASILGTETLLRWMVKEKEAVHKIMDIITVNNGEYIKEVGKRGFGMSFADPVSSTTLIRKKQFEEFSLPYLKRNIADVQKYCGSSPGLHICGDSKKLWELLKDSGIGNFSLDNCESLAEAKEILGNDMVITGNVPPVDVMFLGNTEDVKRSVKECIDIAHDSPCGYILSTGCQIPKGTKIENIDAFMQYGREFGNYKRLKELKNETK